MVGPGPPGGLLIRPGDPRWPASRCRSDPAPRKGVTVRPLARPHIRAYHAGNWAFAATVVAGYVSIFSADSPHAFTVRESAALVALGLVYLAFGAHDWRLATRLGLPQADVLYFGVQLALGAAILYLSRSAGFAPIILLPLVGQGVILLSSRWLLVLCALILAAFVVPSTLLFGPAVAARGALTFLPGLVFTVIFTRIAVQAERARGEVARLAAELGEANRKLSEYAAQVEELATAKERNRLAREIHDSLGHYLTVINVQLEAARAVLDSDRPRALDALAKAQALTKDGLAEVRRSVATLRAAPTDGRPLPEAVAALADESRAAGIATELAVLGTPRRLAPQAELTLYRAAQEGLTNLRKHAHASRADLTLDYRADATVRLVVRDNGVGAGAADGGFGLLGVRERAQLLGGAARVRTAAGQGFTLDVEVPG